MDIRASAGFAGSHSPGGPLPAFFLIVAVALACHGPTPGGGTTDDDELTLAEAASFLGVSPRTVIRWVNQGRLPVIWTSRGHRRFRRADIEAAGGRERPSGGA